MQKPTVLLLGNRILCKPRLAEIDLVGQLQTARIRTGPNGPAHGSQRGHHLIQKLFVIAIRLDVRTGQFANLLDDDLNFTLGALDRFIIETSSDRGAG